jgi:hypothetical protein
MLAAPAPLVLGALVGPVALAGLVAPLVPVASVVTAASAAAPALALVVTGFTSVVARPLGVAARRLRTMVRVSAAPALSLPASVALVGVTFPGRSASPIMVLLRDRGHRPGHHEQNRKGGETGKRPAATPGPLSTPLREAGSPLLLLAHAVAADY